MVFSAVAEAGRSRPPRRISNAFFEGMEPRLLLSDGVTNHAAPTITGAPGVALQNVLVAFFTIDDPSALPADQWLGRILWGDGAEYKQIPNVPGPNDTFEFRATHTYAAAGTYEIDVYMGIPFTTIGGHNMVSTSAVISNSVSLSSINVTPANPTIANGATQQFTATGIFSDNSQQDLTSQVTWNSDTPAVATIDTSGLATAISPGNAKITATLGSTSGFTALNVAPPPPQVQSISFDYTHENVVTAQFTQDVGASLSVDDVQLTNLTTSTTIPAAQLKLDYNADTATATFHELNLPDGNYTFKLIGAGITNSAGTPLANDAAIDFFVLKGDANHDRSVGFADLVAVAQNYGQSGKAWPQGDFTGDGTVDFADLVIVAQSYGKTLEQPSGTILPAPVLSAPVYSVAPAQVSSNSIAAPPARPRPPMRQATSLPPAKLMMPSSARIASMPTSKPNLFNPRKRIADSLWN